MPFLILNISSYEVLQRGIESLVAAEKLAQVHPSGMAVAMDEDLFSIGAGSLVRIYCLAVGVGVFASVDGSVVWNISDIKPAQIQATLQAIADDCTAGFAVPLVSPSILCGLKDCAEFENGLLAYDSIEHLTPQARELLRFVPLSKDGF